MNPEKFKLFSNKVAIILKGEEVTREYDDPSTPPETSDTLVRFNGKGDDGHETFLFDRDHTPRTYDTVVDGRYFSFCKTAQKPYDACVVACLILAKYIFKDDIKISSDGEIEGDDWVEGKELMEKKLRCKVRTLKVSKVQIVYDEPNEPEVVKVVKAPVPFVPFNREIDPENLKNLTEVFGEKG